jgi:hypothetical protein
MPGMHAPLHHVAAAAIVGIVISVIVVGIIVVIVCVRVT